jgi:hypothetical protein
MWNHEEIGHNMALKMLIVDGVREPTLTQFQDDSKNSAFVDGNSKWTPAWKFFADPHPGVPGQFLNNNTNDLQYAALPFSLVNREVHYKVIVKLDNTHQKRPSFHRLANGTIIVTGHKLSDEIEHNVEIFLHIHDKLIPCYYTSQLENVIIEDPSSDGGHVRCYYLAVEDAVIEATFLTSRGKVIHRCEYKEMWLHGSTSYQELCNAVKDDDKQ